MFLVDEKLKINQSPSQITASCSAIIATCEDGLPFIFDLADPGCGSILLGGDPRCGKTAFLQAILSSMAQINPHDQVCFAIITPRPEEYDSLAAFPHCTTLLTSRKRDVLLFIDTLLALADRRQYQRNSRPILLVVIDDLADCIHGLNDEAYWGLEWLIRLGPSSGIWILAAQSTSSLRWVDSQLVEAFPTHLLGKITATEHVSCLASGISFHQPNLPGEKYASQNAAIDPGAGCFLVPCDEGWISISPLIRKPTLAMSQAEPGSH